jgi:electron transfer flavoprotein beta subunit
LDLPIYESANLPIYKSTNARIMKIAVCIKQVPTREWQPRIDESRRGVREQDASFEMNEPDAYALEEGLRLRERHGGEVVACTAGPARASQVLREALARGADRAIHVEDDRLGSIGADGGAVAGALADAMRDEAFDLVLTGLQSDDLGAAQTGVILAERLGLPHATIVMDVQVQDARIRVKRELEGGWFQWVEMPLPALVTIQSGINQLRYATLKGIMAAKKKEIRRIAPASLRDSHTSLVGLDVPRKSKQTQIIAGPAAEAARELVDRLRNDARAIE